MNIFVLHTNPFFCARYHNNAHVVKMILETAQLISTANHIRGTHKKWMYRPTHQKHPCTLWTAQSKHNLRWLTALGYYLCREYRYRYGRVHKTELRIFTPQRALRDIDPELVSADKVTPFAQAMPDECKNCDAVTAYRTYYKTHKRGLAKWRKRPAPAWWS